MELEIDVDDISREIARQMAEPDSNVTQLQGQRKPDKELAEDYRMEMLEALERVCDILNRSRSDGLIIGFNTLPDQFGRVTVQNFTIVRPL